MLNFENQNYDIRIDICKDLEKNHFFGIKHEKPK